MDSVTNVHRPVLRLRSVAEESTHSRSITVIRSGPTGRMVDDKTPIQVRPAGRGRRRGVGERDLSAGQQHRGAVAEQALVGGDADAGAVDLAATGLAPQLPHDLAHLGERLGGNGLAEAGQPPDGFTGMRPPIEVAPSLSSFSASPGLQSPMSSYQSSSSAVDRS